MAHNNKGWRLESVRHSLAAKGVKTGKRKGNGILKKVAIKAAGIPIRIYFLRREVGYPIKKVLYPSGAMLAGGMIISKFGYPEMLPIAAAAGIGLGAVEAVVTSQEFVKKRDKMAKDFYHKPYKKLTRKEKNEVLGWTEREIMIKQKY